jgi:hypothetical protein
LGLRDTSVAVPAGLHPVRSVRVGPLNLVVAAGEKLKWPLQPAAGATSPAPQVIWVEIQV